MDINQKRSRKRRISLLSFVLVVLAVVLLFAFAIFLEFSHKVSSVRVPQDPRADAIVVLTGGTRRVEQGLQLLSEGRAQRLLISGVHPGTSPQQIATLTSMDMPMFECCVDLDRLALNTAGNATETATWAKSHHFKSLLLVTSSYHLPRAQMELESVLPNVKLIPYPVSPDSVDLKHWYENLAATELLLREYMKYVLAYCRIRVMLFGELLGL
ncbi:MAG: YdcF family protein [Rhodobacteraceae bacterium]|nr:YdcF family protein [Paracoccaceae bacterium]